MDELFLALTVWGLVISVIMVILYICVIYYIHFMGMKIIDKQKIAIAKQDAIMEKLIEIKLR